MGFYFITSQLCTQYINGKINEKTLKIETLSTSYSILQQNDSAITDS